MNTDAFARQVLTLPTRGTPTLGHDKTELAPVEVESTVLPPDHFEGDGCAVQSFAAASGFIGALRYNAGGDLCSYLYTDKGRRIDTTIQCGAFLPYAVSGNDILNVLSKGGHTGIILDSTLLHELDQKRLLFQKHITIEELGEKLGLTSHQSLHLARELGEHSALAGHDISAITLSTLSNLKSHPFIPIHASLVGDPEGMQFAFIGSTAITIYETRNEQGVALRPSEWTRSVFSLKNGNTKRVLEKHPWLAEHIHKRIPIPGLSGVSVTINNERAELEIFKDQGNELILRTPAHHLAVNPLSNGGIYFATKDDPAIYRIQTASIKKVAENPSDSEIDIERFALPRPGLVSGLRCEPRGNFIIAKVSGDKGCNEIIILDQINLRLSSVIPEVLHSPDDTPTQCCQVDQKGNIVFRDQAGNLRLARTSMGQLEPGALRGVEQRFHKMRLEQQKKLEDISKSITSLTAPPSASGTSVHVTPQGVEHQLTQRLRELFEQPIIQASTPAELHTIQLQIQELCARPDFKSCPRAFDFILESVADKESTLVVGDLSAKLLRAKGLLSTDTLEWVELIEATKLLERYRSERPHAVIRNHQDRAKLQSLSNEVADLLTERRSTSSQRLELDIQGAFERYSELLTSCASVREVEKVSAEASPLLIDMISALADRGEVARRTNQVNSLTDGRKKEIVRVVADEERRIREEQMKAIEQLAALRETLKIELYGVHSTAEVDQLKRTSPLVKEYYSWMGRLSENLMRHEQERLESLFEQHNQRLSTGPVTAQPTQGSPWQSLLPVFTQSDIVWAPELKPDPEFPGMGRLRFVDNLGRIFEPDHELLPLNPSDERVLGVTEKYSARARDFFEGVTRDIPAWSDEWVINGWTEMCLSQFGKVARQQLRGDNGIIIVRSEAGLGKNVMWDIFACLTQRNLTTFSCNVNTEVDDLTFIYQYDPTKRGTYKLNSQFLERIQIPGSIILLDEVNALPPGVKKVLNSLFDYRRTLFLPDGRRIKAHPSVIFVGLENYNSASYQGVQSHSMDLVSRARVIELQYPSFRETNGYYSPFEAELYAKQLPMFKGVSSADFKKMWDAVINSQVSTVLQSVVSPERTATLKNVKRLVQTAVAIRELHRSENLSGQPGYVFTPRDGRQVMAEIRDGAELLDALHAVVLPKIEERELRSKVEAVIDGVISKKFAQAA